jgi:hypothetical protein
VNSLHFPDSKAVAAAVEHDERQLKPRELFLAYNTQRVTALALSYATCGVASGRGWRRDDCVCCCGVASLLEATGADYAVMVLRITRHLVLTGVD